MATKRQRMEQLGAVRLFSGLSKTDLRYLEDISKVVQHEEGHTVMSEGGRGAGFHLILDGQVGIVRGGRTVVTLGPGDFFGEMSLIDGLPRTATVVARTPVTTLAISQWDFRPLVKRRGEMAWALLVHLTSRLRDAQKREDSLRA